MKKCIVKLGLLVLFLALLLPLSCSMDLEPAKSGKTTVSFSIASLVPPANTVAKLNPVPGRAVSPGEGYLYIRTVGGPTGSKGPFYGPYPLSSGSTFTTSDIPAGSYSHFGILYATEPLENFTEWWNEREMTFTELMSLPDTEFLEFTEGNGEDKPFNMLIAGYASGQMQSAVTIRANQANTIRARLVPFGVQVDSFINLQAGIYDKTPPPGRIRRYFEVTGVYQPDGTSLSSVTWNKMSSTIHRAMLFDESGILLGELRDGVSTSITYSGGERFYVYLDYEGYLASTMTATLVPVSPYTKILYIIGYGEGDGSSPESPMGFAAIQSLNQNTVVCVAGNLDFYTGITVPGGQHMLTSLTRDPFAMTAGTGNEGYFAIDTDGNLTLNNLTIQSQGGGASNPLIIVQGGTLRLEKGATLRNRQSPGALGAGVRVSDGGMLLMNDGALIEKCTTFDNSSEGWGGAVYVLGSDTKESSFTMNGGSIVECMANRGGAVTVFSNSGLEASFTMKGGSISACRADEATYSGNGGGVYIQAVDASAKATFSMSGGTISGCTANGEVGKGGGIHISGSYSYLNLSGTARITSCSANSGRGLYYVIPITISPNPDSNMDTLKVFFGGDETAIDHDET